MTNSPKILAGAALLAVALAAPARADDPPAHHAGGHANHHAAPAQAAPLFEKLGTHTHPVETKNPLAQRYFDQGMALAAAFNHAEAARSFREAQKLDPACAMAYWGEALVLGPNMNAAITEEHAPQAWAALQKALANAEHASPRHRDYIAALAKRYEATYREERADLEQAYADAMRELAAKYPHDYDAQSLLAEALMDTSPWAYWNPDGSPKPVAEEVLRTLERVLTRAPNHPLANHLYIHAVEAAHPEWAIACAERLTGLAPGAGHMVHMPAHIFIRVGRYQEANDANRRAIEVDKTYLTQCHAAGMYPLAYVPHNHHFLWFGLAMTGESKECLAAAQHVRNTTDPKLMREPGYGTLQHFYTLPIWTYVRFGSWDAIMNEPQPAEDLKYPTGAWRFARGMALAEAGKLDEAQAELKQVAALAADESLDQVTIWDFNTTRDLMKISEKVLAAAIAEKQKDFAAAETHLRAAVALEDSLKYDEPPTWFIPARQLLGATLLQAGKPAEAAEAYRADLQKYPGNGWSLLGLQQALQAAGETEEAQQAQQQFAAAWTKADFKPTSSRY